MQMLGMCPSCQGTGGRENLLCSGNYCSVLKAEAALSDSDVLFKPYVRGNYSQDPPTEQSADLQSWKHSAERRAPAQLREAASEWQHLEALRTWSKMKDLISTSVMQYATLISPDGSTSSWCFEQIS